jgi:hypothetical protein
MSDKYGDTEIDDKKPIRLKLQGSGQGDRSHQQ